MKMILKTAPNEQRENTDEKMPEILSSCYVSQAMPRLGFLPNRKLGASELF